MKYALFLSLIVLSFHTMDSEAAQTMLPTTDLGVRCTDEKALALVTTPDGTAKRMAQVLGSPEGNAFEKYCKNAMSGEAVTLVSRRKNTSVVTLNGQTWYVPNIDYMTVMKSCIKRGARQTLLGRVVQGTASSEDDHPSKTYQYARLQLDKPVCFIGNLAIQHDEFVSLPTTTDSATQAVSNLQGQHVQITGTLESPDTMFQPPDNMMMFDPAIHATKQGTWSTSPEHPL
jgi:hypothetical protein